MENTPHLETKQNNLERLLGKATIWAQEQSRIALETGMSLSNSEFEFARVVGVEHPELVRILEVDAIPVPADSELKAMAEATGLSTVKGITFDHGIQILKGQRANWLVLHELRHVYQYEQAGSIQNFLRAYIPQLLSAGYANAPLELDAKNYENFRNSYSK